MNRTPMAVCYDTQACIKCFACVVNCSVENRVRLERESGIGADSSATSKIPHLNYLTVKTSEKGTFPNVTSVASLKHCQHCEHPKCAEICPSGAIEKLATGAVVIDRDKCVGCRSCLDACPFDVPVFAEDSKKAHKCIMCYDRLEEGLPTACSAACPSVAMFTGTAEEVREEAKLRAKHYEEVFGKKFVVYGGEPVNGHVGKLSFITIAPAENMDVYQLPENPKSAVSIARQAIKVAGGAAIVATAAGIALHVNHWNKHKESSVYNHHDDGEHDNDGK